MTLTITNIAAHNLRAVERKAEKQDPYVYFKLGRHTTKTVQDKNGGLNSAWAEVLHLDTDTADRTLDVKVYNKNLLKDDLIGSATVSLDALAGGVARLPLVDTHGQPAGEVTFNISGPGITSHGTGVGVAAPAAVGAGVGAAGVGAATHGHHGHHAPTGVPTTGAAYNTPGAYNTGAPTTTTGTIPPSLGTTYPAGAQTASTHGTGYTTGVPTSGTGYTTGAPTSGVTGAGYTSGAPTSGVTGSGYTSGAPTSGAGYTTGAPTGQTTGSYNQGNPSLADRAGNAVASTVAAAQRGLQKTEEKVSKQSHHDSSESSEYRSTTTY